MLIMKLTAAKPFYLTIIIFKIIVTIGVLFFFQYKTSAQNTLPAVEIPGSQIVNYTSSIVAGQKYDLLINLPGNYQNSNKKYPVIFLLDAQWDFPLLSAIYGEQYFDGYMPAAIIVGIRWGGQKPNPDSLRARDFTPTNIQNTIQSGGAPKFLSFIKTELIPFIESKYRVTDNRTLIGSSLGGLFTLYALFNEPEVFSHYVLTSPALGWDNGVLSTYEKTFSEKKLSKPVTLSMAMGDMEGGLTGYKNWVTKFQSRGYKNVTMESRILENTGHSGTKAEGYTRGLQFAFAKPSLKLSSSVLNQYVGEYEIQPGVNIKVVQENNGLAVITPDGTKLALTAESDTDFYIKGQFLFASVQKNDAGKISGIQLQRFGREDFLKKVK